MRGKIKKCILMLLLVAVCSSSLFAGKAIAASTEKMLSVEYLSQCTPAQWVDQWQEHMRKPSPIAKSMNCGPAASVMLEAYVKGTIPSPERILEVDEFIYNQLNDYRGEDIKSYSRPPIGYEYCGPVEGIYSADIKTILQDFMGLENVILETGKSIEDIKKLIDEGSPVIVPVNRIYSQNAPGPVFHYTLVRGYDGERFYFNDPGKPDSIGSVANFTFEEFEEIWQTGRRIITIKAQKSEDDLQVEFEENTIENSTNLPEDGLFMQHEIKDALMRETYIKNLGIAVDSNAEIAIPMTVQLTIFEKVMSVNAYSIKNTTFVMLKELINTLNRASKKYDVSWDEINQSIRLIPMDTRSVEVQGFVQYVDDEIKVTVQSNIKTYLDAQELPVEVYNIGGYNYYNLLDLVTVLNINVTTAP